MGVFVPEDVEVEEGAFGFGDEGVVVAVFLAEPEGAAHGEEAEDEEEEGFRA